MALSSTTCSDLRSTAKPRELGHFHPLKTQNCKGVIELPNTSASPPAGTTHTLCSARGWEPHWIMLYTKGMKILSVLQRRTFYTQRMRPGSPFLAPHAYKLIFLVIKSDLQLLLSSREKWNQLLANMTKFTWLHLYIKDAKHAHSPLSSLPCCNLHTSLEILRSAFHAARWNRMEVTRFSSLSWLFTDHWRWMGTQEGEHKKWPLLLFAHPVSGRDTSVLWKLSSQWTVMKIAACIHFTFFILLVQSPSRW